MMQISEAWLRELVNPLISTEALASQLTMAGLEVDSVKPTAEFSAVVVGEVMAVAPHANANQLKVCQVSVSATEILQIVCGANNVRVGLKTPVALVGAVLAGNFKIKKAKLRGELSLGMLCSEQELGLATHADGLMELSADASVGVDVRAYLGLDDNVITLDLTPNRADCLSVEGIAREVAVLNKMDWRPVEFVVAPISNDASVAVNVIEKQACPRYLGRLIQDIDLNAKTPLWMQERLKRSSIRSLGVLVDVTNYVLLELGQPLHAFDADTLRGAITVRTAKQGEKLALLNGQTIRLDDTTLVIADEQQALALAGIMGGQSSAVTSNSRNIFLECAFFAPHIIAGKARQFGLHTDSSHRFERGVDFGLQQRAIERATQLIVDIAGGCVGAISDVTTTEYLPTRSAVTLTQQQIKRVLGVSVDNTEVERIFDSLGMQIVGQDGGWRITPPCCRFDIAIEADLLEEVGRIYGYHNLPNNSLLMHSELDLAQETVLPLARIEDLLVDRGYQEVITYSFVSETMQKIIATDDPFIPIKNPISAELSVMRTTLWCGLLNAALHNSKRQQMRIRLFETGLRFMYKNKEIVQQRMLSGLILGTVFAEQWAEKNRTVDFFDMKGDVSAIFHLNHCKVQYKKTTHTALHPEQSAEILNKQGTRIGLMGMLHPALEKQLDFDTPVFLFELAQEWLVKKPIPTFKTLSKFPLVRRDMAFIVKQTVTASAIISCIHRCHEATIKDIVIFDIYQGKGVEDGYKSVALSLVLQNATQTLTNSEIDVIFNKVLKMLENTIDARLRD